MGYFTSLDISASGLAAQRARMDVISQNIANVNTTKTENGTPYRRKVVNLESSPTSSFSQYLSDASKGSLDGKVRVAGITEDMSDFNKIYDPENPEADEEGYVLTPNVDIVTEMVNMISATRSYEANVTATSASKSMAMKALEIGR